MKKYGLVIVLCMLAACGPSEEQKAVAQAVSNIDACAKESHSATALVDCQYPQFVALYTAEHVQYQDVLPVWRSEQLAIIHDAEQGKIPASVATSLFQQSADRFEKVMLARQQAQQEAEAKGPPALQLLNAVAATTEAVHQVSDCTGGETKKERCRQQSASDDYFNCLQTHDEYFCAPLKDAAGIH